jgi:hypothetical protein
MSKVPVFGFSAFLRLACSSEKPQKSGVRKRHSPAKKGGYDFHKSLRAAVRRLSSEPKSEDEVLKYLKEIKRPAERASAVRGFIAFAKWRKGNAEPSGACEPIFITSPKGLYKIKFDADLLLDIGGRRTAVHVWNTKSKLDRNTVMALLSVLARSWPDLQSRPDDFAVLSLPDDKLYKWSDDPKKYRAAGELLLDHFDRLCEYSRAHFDIEDIGDEATVVAKDDVF